MATPLPPPELHMYHSTLIVSAGFVAFLALAGCGNSDDKESLRPDLAFSAGVSATPIDPAVGQPITLGWTVVNRGQKDSKACTWRVLSNGVTLVEGTIAALQTDQTTVITATITDTPGYHTYTVLLDATNLINEDQPSVAYQDPVGVGEANNSAAISLVVAAASGG